MGLDARDIARLSPQAQAQVLGKIKAKQRQKECKYHNEPTAVRGIRFDSKKEAQRYEELMVLVRAGMIRKLKLQQDFILQEGYTTPDGERVRPIKYVADFTYERKVPDGRGGVHWAFEAEDVKSDITEKNKTFQMKRKLLQEKYGLAVKVVK